MKLLILVATIWCCCIVNLAIARLSRRQVLDQALNELTDCERAVWSCCQSDRQTNISASPSTVNCFEEHNCPGLQWVFPEGEDGEFGACAHSFVISIGNTIVTNVQRITEEQDRGTVGLRRINMDTPRRKRFSRRSAGAAPFFYSSRFQNY